MDQVVAAPDAAVDDADGQAERPAPRDRQCHQRFGGAVGRHRRRPRRLLPSRPRHALATVPIACLNLGVAIGAIPAAQLMRRIGRRLGFMIGSLIAFFGCLIAALAIFVGSFLLFTFGLLVLGGAGSFIFQYRFAAAEAGSPARSVRSISWVLAGGIVSAVVGPQLVIYTRHLLDPIPFAGAFVAMAC